MRKEIEPIQQLEQGKENLSHIIRQRESIVQKIGTDKVWIGFQPQGESRVNIDRVIIRSTPEATAQVGYARKVVRENISSLNNKVDEINNEILARNHISILSQIEKLVISGDLSEDDLRFHQQQFEKLQEQNPSLRKTVGMLRKDEEEKRDAEPQSGTTSFPEVSAEIKSEEREEPKEEPPINDSIPEDKTIVLSQPEKNVEEREGYVDGIVKDYLRNKLGSSEVLSVLGQKMIDLLKPVEMRFRDRWKEQKGEDNFREWRSRVNSDYNILGYPKLILPEAQHLKQIQDEIRFQFRIESKELVFITFNECLNILTGNFSSYRAYMQSAFNREAIRDIHISEVNRGLYEGKHTRGLGVDVNPPSSRSEWRG